MERKLPPLVVQLGLRGDMWGGNCPGCCLCVKVLNNATEQSRIMYKSLGGDEAALLKKGTCWTGAVLAAICLWVYSKL